MKYNIIVACDKNNGIGNKNDLPWKTNKADLHNFKILTVGNMNNAIIMGKNTFLSIKKILPNRFNIIISQSLTYPYLKENFNIGDMSNLIILNNIEEAILFCEKKKFDIVWIIGGEKIYKSFFETNIITQVFQTIIQEEYECDCYFPTIPNFFEKTYSKPLSKNPKTFLLEWNLKI